ncbi:MAG: hypothetical protein JXA81_05805 [Sedimentisphaerales bacterium]|nr:hypothetical protein [Sedimentisphaerales bacterium]
MVKSQILLSLVLLACICTIGFAADSGDLAKENAELRQKLNQIDQELQSLKKTVMEQDGETMDAMPKMVWSNLDIQLYGYLKLDAAYDSSRINNGNYGKWVENESVNKNDDQFNMTANESRLGAILNGPDDGQMKTSGLVEVDFFGPGDGIAENQGRLMMRHAYIMLDWPDNRFNIIAGQTSDVISPLYPRTVNYSVGWFVGNIGYRRPQIRLTKELGFEKGGFLKLEGAVARTIGDTSITMTDSGEDAGFPTFQGRASLTFDETTIGLSGHWGQEEYDTTDTGHNREFTTWSLNLDYTQPICKKVEIKAELFTGENLSAYLGGIGQGVMTDTTLPNYYEEIGSKGGWIAAGLGPWDNKRFNVGVTVDDVDSSDVNVGDRTLNRCVFGNVYCAVNKQTDVAFELSHWRTQYRGPGDGESLRAQMALIYKF